MDYSLRLSTLCTQMAKPVLILILMDYSLSGNTVATVEVPVSVLILILMDYSLRLNVMKSKNIPGKS